MRLSQVGLVVVWIFLVAVGTVYAEAAAYTLQGKQGDAETPSDSSVIEDEGAVTMAQLHVSKSVFLASCAKNMSCLKHQRRTTSQHGGRLGGNS